MKVRFKKDAPSIYIKGKIIKKGTVAIINDDWAKDLIANKYAIKSDAESTDRKQLKKKVEYQIENLEEIENRTLNEE